MPDVRSIRGVELLKVGTWDAHTVSGEPWTVTAADLRSAVEAYDACLVVPVVKIGHGDERFSGEPAMGTVSKLRLSRDGKTLLGDFEGVPARLAGIMASAYPHRSVEALLDFEAEDGTRYPLVIEAVALLGAAAPAVKGLRSIENLYGVAASRVSIPVAGSMGRPRIVPGVARLDTLRAVKVAAARRRRTHRLTTKG
ncbi:hypothetical protein MSIMFI_03793 [Mycobacterium simulans]|uniref:hypothetical protein n=1 Tax=Mycobacterium simulans TaxID=627089 RepID=UPI0017490B87|nr:hypothetical protein [Mycobacterium simulans]SON62268.1 hypothetical protein MSIMFI_03793 [Mycobacterium simulans]